MDGMKSQIKSMLQGIERYNPENIKTLEHYVDLQAREKGYDLSQKYFIIVTKIFQSYLLQKYFQVRPGGQPGPAEAVPVQPDQQQHDGRGPDPAQVSDQPSSHRLCPL